MRMRSLMVLATAALLAGCSASAPESATTPSAASAAATSARTPEAPAPATQSESPSPTAAATPEEAPFEASLPIPHRAVNALLIGSDTRDPATSRGQADTIILAHIPGDRSKLYLVSFPRDMFVPIVGHGESGLEPGKLNASYAYGGVEMLTETIIHELGGDVPIDYTFLTTFGGFTDITRGLGSIEVDNKHASSALGHDFPIGPLTLTEENSLTFVRDRKTLPNSDLDRAERGRSTLIGILDRMKDRLSQDPASFPSLVANLYANVDMTGDLSVEDLVALVPLMESLTTDDVVSLQAPLSGPGEITYREEVGPEYVQFVNPVLIERLGDALRSDTMAEYVSENGTEYV